jgi:hypothetical protein
VSAGAAALAPPGGADVLVLGSGLLEALRALLARCGLTLACVADGEPIPFSYWGEPEAGLEQRCVWVRADTPLHSALHEACHALCMDGARRAALERDAGGDFDEENAVCCLQILLADELPGVGAARLMQDMDRWGYTFRLGSARRWYESEAEEARAWLVREGLLDDAGRLVFRARD